MVKFSKLYKLKMQDKVESIITKHNEQIKHVDVNQSIAKIVKQIESITYDTYRELYGLRDIRHNNFCLNSITVVNKHGHCC